MGVYLVQSMARDKNIYIYACPGMCKIQSTSERSPMKASLSRMQPHMPNMIFFVATKALVTDNVWDHEPALSCSILNMAPKLSCMRLVFTMLVF